MAYAAVCSNVVDSLFIATPIVEFCNCYMFCCALPYVNSRFAINLTVKRNRVSLSSWCHVIAVWFFLAVSWVLSAVCDCHVPLS